MEKIKKILLESNMSPEIIVFETQTETSQAAAEALGCNLAQIAKSILFKGKKSGEPIMVVASGANFVDAKKIKNLVNENVRTANAEFVKECTGYEVGGVAPFGYPREMKIFIDEDLFKYDEIWPAAGTSNSMFKITPSQLKEITNGIVADIKKE